MAPMPIDCVILDFDGTFTRVDEEAAPFEEVYKANLADLLGKSIDEAWATEAAHIRDRPHGFGWTVEGKIVAPATSDPYLLASAVAQRVFDAAGILKNVAFRAEVTQALYRDAYKYTRTAFKQEAKGVLEALLASNIRVVVVTNSHTEVVQRKLDTLAPEGRLKLEVVGDAKKYVVDEPVPTDEHFEALPATRNLPELNRPVYLRRGRYYEVLRRIWRAAGSGPERTLVCGDIYELDLALPEALGAHVHLVCGQNTLPFERAAMEAAGPRGGVSDSLQALIPRVLG
jgi:phosphoglycolate phosphatase-like HAD superfamily hydrolase